MTLSIKYAHAYSLSQFFLIVFFHNAGSQFLIILFAYLEAFIPGPMSGSPLYIQCLTQLVDNSND